LIDLCLQARRPTPATFNFCSSVSAVAATPGGMAKEALPTSLTHAQNMGYAQSKLVTEHICAAASAHAGMKARVIRIGQVIADTKHGVWNATEAIPMIFQTAKTIGALPRLDERPAWLPVDLVAQAVNELSLSNMDGRVVNLVNHNTFHWTTDLLPWLREAGLTFEELDQRAWRQKLRSSDPNPVTNPPFKLVEFFAGKYDRDGPRPGLGYETDSARRYSPALAAARVANAKAVSTFINYFSTACWDLGKSNRITKPVIVLGGPCGSGKSTAAMHIADNLNLSWVEGDSLHSAGAIAKMAGGNPLTDEDRWDWLQRIRAEIVRRLVTDGEKGVVVACSALKQVLRDDLRLLNQGWGATVHFILLMPGQSEPEDAKSLLKERLEQRKGHYMKATMVDAQVAACEAPREEETDAMVVAVDSNGTRVLDEVLQLSREFLGN